MVLRRLTLLVAILAATLTAGLPAQAAEPMNNFIRFVSAIPSQEHLDTAIVRYQRGPQIVDLVGAVHIGDVAYYNALNTRFATYDKVLFELVKPEEFDMRDFAPSTGGVSAIQRVIKDFLDLDFQLDRIHYRARNFVHADIDSKRLGEKMRQHAADILGALLAWSIGDAARLRHDDGTLRLTSWELVVALTDPDRPRALKRLLARELSEMDISAGDVGGLGFGSILIGDRNQVAIAVLERELRKKAKKFAIFYGAAHLPDLDQRLRKLGFSRGDRVWLSAWDLRPPAIRGPTKH